MSNYPENPITEEQWRQLDVTRPEKYAAVEIDLDDNPIPDIDDAEGIANLMELAAQYLSHPDVAEMPFALPSTAVARRLTQAVDKLRGV